MYKDNPTHRTTIFVLENIARMGGTPTREEQQMVGEFLINGRLPSSVVDLLLGRNADLSMPSSSQPNLDTSGTRAARISPTVTRTPTGSMVLPASRVSGIQLSDLIGEGAALFYPELTNETKQKFGNIKGFIEQLGANSESFRQLVAEIIIEQLEKHGKYLVNEESFKQVCQEFSKVVETKNDLELFKKAISDRVLGGDPIF